MKTYLRGFVAAAALFAISSTHAQMGGGMGGRGPQIDAAMAQLFGENAFTSDVDVVAELSAGQTITMPAKTAFDAGKSRFEIDLSKVSGSAMPPGMGEQMKSMGMDRMIMITRPDKKVSYLVYPGLKAYAEQPLSTEQAAASSDFKIEKTEQGQETVAGHPTVKNKVTVTDKQGRKHEFIAWNATDLKDFPIKIETTQEGVKATMSFKNPKLSKPEASQFDAPPGHTKYENSMTMLQTEMSKRMGGGAGGATPGGE